MPPEPKRPIEELLEGSAKARRAEFGAAPAMPNPMRARLHDEIARMNREEESRPRRSWLAIFWPQISIATAIAAVLVTAAVMWLRNETDSGHEGMQIAINAPVATQPEAVLKSLDAPSQSRMQSEPVLAEQSADGTVTSGSLADNVELAKPGEVEGRTDAGDSSALAKFGDVAIAAAPPAAMMRARPSDAKEETESAPTTARADVAQNAASSAMAPESFARQAPAGAAPLASKDKNFATNLQQQFSQTSRGQAMRSNAKLNQAVNVLETFQVEQDGHEIRVVDADGSTYTGKFEPIARSSNLRMLKQPAPATEAARREGAGGDAGTNERAFRATGFNTSLKKRVVFEGNYIPLPSPEKKAAAKAHADEPQQAPARIVGKATLPGEAPVQVDAITTAR